MSKHLWLLLLILVSGCSREPNDQAQGYLEGRYTYISANVAGKLEKLYVSRGQKVAKDQLLLSLEAQPEQGTYRAEQENLRQTIAARDAIAANFHYAKVTYARYQTLVNKHAIQQAQLDDAKANYAALQAQLAKANAAIAGAQASLAQAKWTLDQKSRLAPKAGLIFDIYFRTGEIVSTQQSIMALLAPEDIKAIFYVSEKDLGRMQLNAPITIRCDGCSKSYRGKISFISPVAEFTPPVIFSEQTKADLVFRVEASFNAKTAYLLHPGQPITVLYE